MRSCDEWAPKGGCHAHSDEQEPFQTPSCSKPLTTAHRRSTGTFLQARHGLEARFRTAGLVLCALGIASLPRAGGSGQAGRDSALVLAPGMPLDRQAMRYGESRMFRLSQLAASAMYEVKVSYPASMPATINLELLLPGQSGAATGRRLLNTEKIMFTTPEDAATFCAEAAVRVTVAWDSVLPGGGGSVPAAGVLFNIEVARAPLGVPLSAVPHALAALALVVLALVASCRRVPWWPASLVIPASSPTPPPPDKRS